MSINMPLEDIRNLYPGMHVILNVTRRDEDGNIIMAMPISTATNHETALEVIRAKSDLDPSSDYDTIYCVRKPQPEEDRRRTTSELIVKLKESNGDK